MIYDLATFIHSKVPLTTYALPSFFKINAENIRNMHM